MAKPIPSASNKPQTYLSNTEKDIYEYEGENWKEEIYIYNERQTSNSRNKTGLQAQAQQSASGDHKAEVFDDELNAGAAFQFFKQKESKPPTSFGKSFSQSNLKDSRYLEMMPSYVLNTGVISDKNELEKDTNINATNLFVRDTVSTQFETPLGRLNRLENELRELGDFIQEQMVTPQTHEKDHATLDYGASKPKFIEAETFKSILLDSEPRAIMEEISILESRVKSLSGDPKVRLLFEHSDPISNKESGFSKIKSHLENNLNNSNRIDSDFEGQSHQLTNNELITYELYTEKSMKPILDNSRIIEIERRIASLESHLGVNKFGFIPFGDLTSAIDQISSRLLSLDHKRIGDIKTNMHILLTSLQAVNSKRKELTGLSVDDHKIESLFELCNRWKLIAYSTPSIIKRLQTLKQLHQEANGINSRLKLMEAQMEEMKNVIETTRTSFDEIRSLVNENTEWAKRTSDGLNMRISELS